MPTETSSYWPDQARVKVEQFALIISRLAPDVVTTCSRRVYWIIVHGFVVVC